MSKTDALDLLSLACVALFAFAVWPPLCLLAIAAAAALQSWKLTR